MYSSHSIWLMVTGVILLLAMVGAIVITLDPKGNKGDSLNKINLYKSFNLGKNTSLSAKPYGNKGYRRFYSVQVGSCAQSIDNISLPSQYVTGFVDAEGCFRIKITKDSKRTSGMRVVPSFEIHLDKRELALVHRIKTFFGVGSIRVSKTSVVYSVASIVDINKVIIPHFDKYILITQKRADFLLFKMAMNRGLSQDLRSSFPYVVIAERPAVDYSV